MTENSWPAYPDYKDKNLLKFTDNLANLEDWSASINYVPNIKGFLSETLKEFIKLVNKIEAQHKDLQKSITARSILPRKRCAVVNLKKTTTKQLCKISYLNQQQTGYSPPIETKAAEKDIKKAKDNKSKEDNETGEDDETGEDNKPEEDNKKEDDKPEENNKKKEAGESAESEEE